MPRPPAPPAQDYVEIQNLYAFYNLSSDAGDPRPMPAASPMTACLTSTT
jgi:hypothetical protein